MTRLAILLAASASPWTSPTYGQTGTGVVDLVWGDRPQVLVAGVEFELSLYAKSVRADGLAQSVSAMDVVMTWDSTQIEYLGLDNNGPYGWLASGFMNDALNMSLADGDAKYTALAQFGAANAAMATPQGLLVTSFRFVALTEIPTSSLVIETSLGPFAFTRVFGADFANQNVTGALGNAAVSVVGPRDCDGDGAFDLREFQHLQTCYTGAVPRRDLGDPPAYPTEPASCCSVLDYDDDGDIDQGDHKLFVELLSEPLQ